MARIIFKKDELLKEKQKVKQGDFVYCKAHGGACSFWGIYGSQIGIVSLDGGGNGYIPKDDNIYLGEIYSYWLIDKIIPCSNAQITIDEMGD